MSIRAITRVAGVSKNTVSKLLTDVGAACGEYQDCVFRNLSCKRVQIDEIWSFCYAKQKNVRKPGSSRSSDFIGAIIQSLNLRDLYDSDRLLKDLGE